LLSVNSIVGKNLTPFQILFIWENWFYSKALNALLLQDVPLALLAHYFRIYEYLIIY